MVPTRTKSLPPKSASQAAAKVNGKSVPGKPEPGKSEPGKAQPGGMMPKGRLNRALAMETYSLMKELMEVMEEEEQTLTQISGLLDRTPAHKVNNEFLNTLSLRMKERSHLLARQRKRTHQMQVSLHRRLEKEGLLKVKLKPTVRTKKVATTKPKDPIITQAAPKPTVTQPDATLEQASQRICGVCDKELIKGERFARCNHDNIFFHAPCLAPYYDCPTCNDHLSDFMGIFAG